MIIFRLELADFMGDLSSHC